MAWTASDLETVETAIRTALTEGIASVSIAGEMVTAYTLAELREMRTEIKAELAQANPRGNLGLTFRKLIPPGAG